MKERDIHIRISDDKYQILKQIAEKEYRKVTAIIERAIDRYLKSRIKNNDSRRN